VNEHLPQASCFLLLLLTPFLWCVVVLLQVGCQAVVPRCST